MNSGVEAATAAATGVIPVMVTGGGRHGRGRISRAGTFSVVVTAAAAAAVAVLAVVVTVVIVVVIEYQ